MKIWIDTEFTTFKGKLISMALIDENDTYFYEVLDFNQSECHPWVIENVVPILGKEPITLEQFEHRFWNYIKKYDSIHLIADWPDDIKYFCEVLHTQPGEMMNVPSTFTMEVCRRLPPHQSAIPHNALEDTIAIKEAYLRKGSI
jgi:hypothetical protein